MRLRKRVLGPTSLTLSYNLTSLYETIKVTLDGLGTHVRDDVGKVLDGGLGLGFKDGLDPGSTLA